MSWNAVNISHRFKMLFEIIFSLGGKRRENGSQKITKINSNFRISRF